MTEIEKLKACKFAIEQAIDEGQNGCLIWVGKSMPHVDWNNLREELIRDIEEVQNEQIPIIHE